jgi:hypothetical protein
MFTLNRELEILHRNWIANCLLHLVAMMVMLQGTEKCRNRNKVLGKVFICCRSWRPSRRTFAMATALLVSQFSSPKVDLELYGILR